MSDASPSLESLKRRRLELSRQIAELDQRHTRLSNRIGRDQVRLLLRMCGAAALRNTERERPVYLRKSASCASILVIAPPSSPA